MSNKNVKQDALDNLADALTEDILNAPDDELLREVEEDYGDPRALANKFDQILERAEKQVFASTRPAASPQVRSSVLDLPISSPDETIRWVKGIFDLGGRLSEFLSSLTPRTLAWSATAAAVAILVPAAVITAVIVKEQGAPSGEMADISVDLPPRASLGMKADRLPMGAVLGDEKQAVRTAEAPLVVGPPGAVQSSSPASVQEGTPVATTQRHIAAPSPPARNLSSEEIESIITRGRALIAVGDIVGARLVLQQAAEAGNATAALELGGTYDPTILQKQQAQSIIKAWQQRRAPVGEAERVGVAELGRGRTGGPDWVAVDRRGRMGWADSRVAENQSGSAMTPDVDMLAERVVTSMADITKAKLWYEKAKDLGSTEAAARLERLTSVPGPRR